MSHDLLRRQAQEYAQRYRTTIDFSDRLGFGTDGYVWSTDRKTAVKAFEREFNYCCERDCYQRLSEHKIVKIDDFSVPQFEGFDDELMVVEMKIVKPPCILDFGKAYVDHQPQHTPEVIEETRQAWMDLFEEDWPVVARLLWQLEQIGIYYQDPKPANIMF